MFRIAKIKKHLTISMKVKYYYWGNREICTEVYILKNTMVLGAGRGLQKSILSNYAEAQGLNPANFYRIIDEHFIGRKIR